MGKRIGYWFKKDFKIIALSLAIGFVAAFSVAMASKGYANQVSQELSSNFIRFHVLANSDTKADQQLKLAVRDTVLATMQERLSQSETIEETRSILIESFDIIEQTALDTIAREGFSYGVNVSLTTAMFPTKSYGDVSLPAGPYEALRIEIGDAQGQNWWCVMFPPLCYVDITHDEVPEETKLEIQNLLPEEEYALITKGIDSDDLPIRLKFKLVEWWQEKQPARDILVHAQK